MKSVPTSSFIFQFLFFSFWFASTLSASILYRMLLAAMFFEFPSTLLLGHSVIFLAILQLIKLLFPDYTKTWKLKIDPSAIPASLLLSAIIFLDLFAFYSESTSSKLIQYLTAPVVSVIVLKSSGLQRAKIRRNIPVMLAILSTVFTFSAVKVSDLSSDGMFFGVLVFSVNVATLFTFRKYLESNSIPKFLFTHFSLLTVVLFLVELYQHDVHRLFLYVSVWQIIYFPPVFLAFVVTFSFSILSFCHIITYFDLSTVAVSMNTMSGWQFIIANWLYQNVAMKEFFELGFTVNVSAVATVLLNLLVFWVDVKGRCAYFSILRNHQ